MSYGQTADLAAAAPTPPVYGPPPELSEAEAMQRILPQVIELGQQNPAAQQALLEKLRQVEPSLWELTAQQHVATLAYNSQLNGASGPGNPTKVDSDVRLASRPTAPNTVQPPTGQPQSPAGQSLSPSGLNAQPRQAAPAASATSPGTAPPAFGAPPLRHGAEAHSPSAATPQVIENRFALDAPEPGGPASPAIQLVSATSPADRHTLDPSDPYPGREAGLSAGRATAKGLYSESAPADGAMWRSSLDATILQLESAAPESPQDTNEALLQARLRLLQLVAGRQGEAVAPIDGLSSTEQAYWSKQLFALSTMLDSEAQPDARRRAAAAGLHLNAAQAELGQLGSLRIRNLTLCDEIYGFGAYEPAVRAEFAPGDQMRVYAEIDNYRSVSTEQGMRTAVATSYRLVNAAGLLVDSDEFSRVEDHCLTRRRDFHIQYGVPLPAELTPGTYRLELTLTDLLGDKIATDAVPLQVVASR
ncbi:hypothetical protein [Pseudobythopirellula maris]|uniref:hypothetical protein n=1 Tax=Pseudobythopirellula maris TaxID=2527991 RepID=UPI0018D2E8CB|nr:hypothetical protein [Pseudobythopirellula maris]